MHSEKNHPKFGVIGSRELCEQFINRLPGDKVQTGLKYSRSEISGIRVEIDSTFVGQTGRNGVVHVTPGHFTLDFDFINISPSDYNVSTTDESIIKFIEEHDVICPLIDLSGINAQMSLSDIHNHIKRLVTPLTIFLHTIDLYKHNEFIGVNWDPNVRDIRNTFVDTVGAGLEQNILKKFREQKTSAPYMTQTISGHSLPAGHDPYSNYDDFLYAYDLQLSQASRLAMGVRGQYVQ